MWHMVMNARDRGWPNGRFRLGRPSHSIEPSAYRSSLHNAFRPTNRTIHLSHGSYTDESVAEAAVSFSYQERERIVADAFVCCCVQSSPPITFSVPAG